MLAGLALAAALAASPPVAPERELRVGIGGQRVVTIPTIARLAVEDEPVVDIKPIGSRQLLIIGLQKGKTRLHVWRSNGAHLVYEVEVRNYEGCSISELRHVLGETPEMKMVGDRIYLDGTIASAEDLEKVRRAHALYPNVQVLAKLDPKVIDDAVQVANRELLRAHLDGVTFTVAGGELFIEGRVENEADRRKAEVLAQPIRELLRDPAAP